MICVFNYLLIIRLCFGEGNDILRPWKAIFYGWWNSYNFVWLINLIDFFRMIDRFCGSSLKMFFWDIKFREISVYRTVLWREGNLDFYDIKYKIMGWFLQNVLANSCSDFQDTFKSLSINNPFLTRKNSNFLQYFQKRMEIPYKKSITTT